jgi:hypothetical protein
MPFAGVWSGATAVYSGVMGIWSWVASNGVRGALMAFLAVGPGSGFPGIMARDVRGDLVLSPSCHGVSRGDWL